MFLLVLPFEWWMPRQKYQRLNGETALSACHSSSDLSSLIDYVMGVIYSPLLLVTAALETRSAFNVRRNRKRAQRLASRGREADIPDDDSIEEWEEMEAEIDFEADGWAKKVEKTCPNVIEKRSIVEIKALRKEIEELKEMISRMSPEPDK